MWVLETEEWYSVIAARDLIHGTTAPAPRTNTSLLIPESRKLITACDSTDSCTKSPYSHPGR